MWKKLILLLLLVNCGDSDSIAATQVSAFSDIQLEKTNVLTNLKNPWDMAFANDGSIFFTEKCRGLSGRKPQGAVVRLFGTAGSAVVAGDLMCAGQSGVRGRGSVLRSA